MDLVTCLQESDADALCARAALVVAPYRLLVRGERAPAEAAAVLSVITAAARVRDPFPGDDFEVEERFPPLSSERGRVKVDDRFAEDGCEDLCAQLGR